MEMLKPVDIGPKEIYSSKINIKSLFNNNNFITMKKFGDKLGVAINFLNYWLLKITMDTNIKNNNGIRNDMNEQEVNKHFIFTLTNILQKQYRDHKSRNVLSYKSPISINYHIERWRRILDTERLCESQIRLGYRGMQTRIFPRQFLDFKSRLILRKTQFADTLPKWTNDNTSRDV